MEGSNVPSASRNFTCSRFYRTVDATPAAATGDDSTLGDGTTGIGETASGVWVAAAPPGTATQVSSGAAVPGSSGVGGQNPPLRCYWLEGSGSVAEYSAATSLVPHDWYLFWCDTAGAGVGNVAIAPYRREYIPRAPLGPGTEITADSLIPRAVEALLLDAPIVATSPPDGRFYVNVPTYLAVTNPNGDGASALARAAGVNLWAYAEARLDSVVFDPGNGDEPLVCDGWGTLYDPAAPDRPPDCGYTFLEAGATTVEATVTWSITYQASNTPPGPWGTITRSTTIDAEIRELESVVTE